MCGICGYVSTAPDAQFPEVLRRLNGGIRHRGPDDEGFFEAPGVGLAMRRLSIVDLSGGHQPIGNEDGSIQIVFNGEIYNYIELREQLLKRGHRFTTHSDTEVLVHLYEDLGEKMLGELRGMFAFAIWDAKRKRLFIARDRLGKKPLNYARTARGLFFCSEIAPLAELPDVDRAVDTQALQAYLLHGYVPAPHSIYRGIRKLPPGHFLVWEQGAVRIEKYWSLDFTRKVSCDYQEGLSRLRETLDESIRLRLRSDVPLGLLLSGGLDSNAVLARLVRGLGQRVQTFTIGFGDKAYDESELARRAAEFHGVEHHVLMAQPNLLNLLPKLVTHYGEPYADKSALPSFLLSELTASKVKVALNGDGGDEAFAGYAKYRLKPWQQSASTKFPAGLRQHWTEASLLGQGVLGGKLARNIRQQWLPETRSLFTNEFFAGRHWGQIASPSLQAADSELSATIADFWSGSLPAVDRMLAWDISHYLADDLLVKMDIASMAYGVEVRSPLLDHQLLELSASFPAEWKGDAQRGKRMLRDIVDADLPPEIKTARKQGFAVPLEKWWRQDARDVLCAGLHPLHPALAEHLVAGQIARLLAEHQNGSRNHAQRLWNLWVLNEWARRFLG